MNAREVEEVIALLGAGQHGVFTGAQARRRGVTQKQLRHRLQAGRIARLKVDIFRVRDHPWTWEAQLQAGLFDVGPGAVLSHRTAGQLHGCWRYRSQNAVEVTGKEQHDHRVTLARLHRSADVPVAHRTVVCGFPVTTIARTCFDLFGDPDPGLRHTTEGRELHATLMKRVLNDALARRGLTLGQLAVIVATIGKRGRPGSALTRGLLDELGPDYVPPESDGESLVMELIDGMGIAEPERQVLLSDEHGWIGTVDFLWRRAAFVLELDGQWHDGPLDQTADAERDRRIEALGLRVLRVRYRDVVANPGTFTRQLRVAVARIGATAHQHSPGGEPEVS
ncbi:MAG TPA: DUF559 domain-containing protein [Acidimicrobiales bacterium]|nr:DUF559 domain-containing protein [Acidimicrobiales bacterium]